MYRIEVSFFTAWKLTYRYGGTVIGLVHVQSDKSRDRTVCGRDINPLSGWVTGMHTLAELRDHGRVCKTCENISGINKQ